MGLIIGIAPIMIGARLLVENRPDPVTVASMIAVIAFCGAVGGAVFHPVGRFWLKGLVSGLMFAIGAMIAVHFYLDVRFMVPLRMFWAELSCPVCLGGLPGIGLYVQLMRDEVVDDNEQDGRRA